MELDDKCDGIMLNSNSPYFEQRIYKWKQNITIDFYVERIKKDIYALFTPISYDHYKLYRPFFKMPQAVRQSNKYKLVLFSPPIRPRSFYVKCRHDIDNKVCEFSYDKYK